MRINTLSLNFSEISERISILEIHRFIERELKLKNEEVVSLAMYGAKVFIKVATQEIFENIFDTYAGKLIFEDQGGQKHEIEIENQSARTTVKIHKIPIEIADSEIRKSLSAFGNVDSIRNDAWKDLPYKCYNDTKLVRMDLRKAVPSYVRIGGRYYWVTYPGQARTCRRCGSTLHEIRDCDKTISSRLVNRNDYASVAANTIKRPLNLAPNEEIRSDYVNLNTYKTVKRLQGNDDARLGKEDQEESDPKTHKEKEQVSDPSLHKEDGQPTDGKHSIREKRQPSVNELGKVSLEDGSNMKNTEIQQLLEEPMETETLRKRKKNAEMSSGTPSGEEDVARPGPYKKLQVGGSWADELSELSDTQISFHNSSTDE